MLKKSTLYKKIALSVSTLVLGALVVGLFNGGLSAVFAQTSAPRVSLPRPGVTGGSTQSRTIGRPSYQLNQNMIANPSLPTSVTIEGNYPMPHFAGINAPVWVTTPDNSSAQIINDVLFQGLTDVRNGIINSTGTVTFYDNLSIQGNGDSEPGNLTIQGALQAQTLTVADTFQAGTLTVRGEVVGGTIGSAHTINGNLGVTGNLVVATTATSTIRNTLTTTNLNVSGFIRANAIGRFYTPQSTTAAVREGAWSNDARATCDENDALVSCTGEFVDKAPGEALWFSSIDRSSCSVRGRSTFSGRGGRAISVRARAVCFSPSN